MLNLLKLLNDIRGKHAAEVEGTIPENLRLLIQGAVDTMREDRKKQILRCFYDNRYPKSSTELAKQFKLSVQYVDRQRKAAVNEIRHIICDETSYEAIMSNLPQAIGECIRAGQEAKYLAKQTEEMRNGIKGILKDEFLQQSSQEAARIRFMLKQILAAAEPPKANTVDRDLWFTEMLSFKRFLDLPITADVPEIERTLYDYRQCTQQVIHCRSMSGKKRTVEILNHDYGIFTYGELLDSFINGKVGEDLSRHGCPIRNAVESVLSRQIGGENLKILKAKEWKLPG